MKQKLLKELKSIAITFIATFGLTVCTALYMDSTFNYFDRVAVIALIVAGARAAVKPVIGALIELFKKMLKK